MKLSRFPLPVCAALALLALPAVPAFASTNGNGVVLKSVSAARTGVGATQTGAANKSGTVRATFAIDPVVARVAQNGRGERVLVGAMPVVESLAALSPIKPGDVTQDGVVTPADAQAVFECYLAGGCPTPDKTAAADLCPGGPVAVTPRDAQAVFELFLGLEPLCQ
ncbi:MAG: hypothetical protein KF858_07450 [Candidatus Sumerlaeia bacterium]|nr:hypothetical protein [Candidatus Sumerlaeia bacterium]